MDQSFAIQQQIRNIYAPACLIRRSVGKLEQIPAYGRFCLGSRRPLLLERSLDANAGVCARCIGSLETLSFTRDQIPASCVGNFKVRPPLRCRKSGQRTSTEKRHRKAEWREQHWSMLERGGLISCQFSKRLQSFRASGEEIDPLRDISYSKISSRITCSSSPQFHDWLPQDFGLTTLKLKSWFKSVCSAALALTICVPQALGTGAVLGDLALNDCVNPEVDYAPLKGLEGVALKEKLHDLIKDHKVYTYLQAWNALKVLDEAKDDPNSVRGSKAPKAKTLDGTVKNVTPAFLQVFDRKLERSIQSISTVVREGLERIGEHLWPRSFGLIEGQPGFSDLHNLRPADSNINSSRGNKVFADCSTQAVACLVPANKEAAPDTGTNKDVWMPPGEVRGDIARAVFYMAVRYGSEQPAGIKALSLSNSPDVENEVMGILKDLVRWNEVDSPSDSERERNDKVCSLYQHNRNPFVDHPEFVKAIWGDGSVPSGSPETPDTPKPPSLPTSEIIAWINELHYDNSGADQDEFVEVIIGQDVDPSTLKLVLYNGNGKEYRSLSLGNGKEFSKVDNIGDGFSLFVARLPTSTLQNGPADGFALVEEDATSGRVIQTLSYEGTFKSVDGPAKGQESLDIGVEEGGKTSVGSSLGLVGTGDKYGDFRWSVFEITASPGTLNPGQTLRRAPSLK